MKLPRPAAFLHVALLLAAALPVAAHAEDKPVPPPVAATGTEPKLIVAIAVDQFSADLFAEYRSRFTGGLARLAGGVVFPSGYQSHAATETCPGHSTILTGAHPSRTGAVSNSWYDLSLARKNKKLNCLEDPAQTPQGDEEYVVTTRTLMVPTLGERMKAANPASRNVAVSGKDRGAVMMGGTDTDAIVWWRERRFETLRGRTLDPAAVAENGKVTAAVAKGLPDYRLPAWCGSLAGPVQSGNATIGTGRLALKAGDARAFRYTPRLDRSTLTIALGMVDEEQLGRQTAPDMLAISLSATDYIGHAFGNQGPEMCIQMQQLDAALGDFFKELDKRRIDYAVVLTGDHGATDTVERLNQRAVPGADRFDSAFLAENLGKAVAARLGLTLDGPLLWRDTSSSDYFISTAITPAQRDAVIAEVKAMMAGNPKVAAVYSAAEIEAIPVPAGAPETWTLLQRARASYYPGRSGDFLILPSRGVVMVGTPGVGYTAQHGGPWDYDRRVPILFWRKGLAGFEQPMPVEAVDIAPTLAAWIGLPVPAGAFDGRCLDIDGGAADFCGGTAK